MLDYGPLWKLMDDNGISQYYLLTYCGIENKTLANIKWKCYISYSGEDMQGVP